MPLVQKPDVCGTVQSDLSKTFLDNINAVIDNTLTPAEKERVQRLLSKYSDIFDNNLGHTTLITHKIDTGSTQPIKQAPGSYDTFIVMRLTSKLLTCYKKE